MRPTTMMTMLACMCAAACSRNDTSGTAGSTTNTPAPGSNALNNNPSGATPMTNDPSGVAPVQPRSADGLEFAGGGREAGMAVGGGPGGSSGSNTDVSAQRSDGGASVASGSGAGSGNGDKGSPNPKGAKQGDGKNDCPGAAEVRVAGANGGAGFCAKACRSDIDCSPNGKCDGVGRTAAKGYSQPNGKYCTGM